MSLKAIVDDLVQQAKGQVDEAYRILGAKPGPGTDLLIYPIQPIDGRWMITGLTKAGQQFVRKFWFGQPILSNELKRLKSEAKDWGLSCKVEYPIIALEDNNGNDDRNSGGRA